MSPKLPRNEEISEFATPPPEGKRFFGYEPEEGLKEKVIQKTKQNPAVPFGIGLTTYALCHGLWQMKLGDAIKSQKYMHLRLVGQGFTICAILCGGLYASLNAHKEKPVKGT